MKLTNMVLLGTLLSAFVYAKHPSFDCAKVKKNSSESVICSSDELMYLDRKIANLYKKAQAITSKEDMLKATQIGWIKSRNDCWKDQDEKACMVRQYNMRIQELKKKYHLSDVEDDTSMDFNKVLSLYGITFHIVATNEGSLNQLTITPSGLSGSHEVLKQEIDGSVTGVEVADLNSDGFPEVYIYINSAGSGSYGSLIAYGSNRNKSITPIFMPDITEDKKLSEGYMGHDEFTVMESSLGRRFPIYNKEDANCCPKGGMRQIEYKLLAGEAGWVLRVKNSMIIK